MFPSSAWAAHMQDSPRRGGIYHYIFYNLLDVRKLLEIVCKFKSGRFGRYCHLKIKISLYEGIWLSSLWYFCNSGSYQPNFVKFVLKWSSQQQQNVYKVSSLYLFIWFRYGYLCFLGNFALANYLPGLCNIYWRYLWCISL